MFTKTLLEYFSNQETPFYYYDMELLNLALNKLQKAAQKYSYNVHYALKANTSNKILSLLRTAI